MLVCLLSALQSVRLPGDEINQLRVIKRLWDLPELDLVVDGARGGTWPAMWSCQRTLLLLPAFASNVELTPPHAKNNIADWKGSLNCNLKAEQRTEKYLLLDIMHEAVVIALCLSSSSSPSSLSTQWRFITLLLALKAAEDVQAEGAFSRIAHCAKLPRKFLLKQTQRAA